MPLYRETATGFLQEWASNPGAGYTAISAMPTDTIANRVAWWRGLDTFGQTSSWHPSEYRSPQDPAEAALSLRFSREAGFISADPDGTVTDAYLAANTTVRVYRGSTDVTITEGWQLTKVEDGCTSTLTESGGVYTLQITNIPLLATRQGYVRITATRIGVTVVRDFNFIKVLKGAQGADGGTGATVVLDNDSHTIPFTNGAGDYSGSGTAVIVFYGASQLTAHATNTTNCFRITAVSASGITAGTLAADKGSIGNHSAMIADTATVTLTIAVYGPSGLYATLTKKQTLSRNSNGLSVSITSNVLVVRKSAGGTFTPSDRVILTAVTKNLPPGKTVNDLIWWYSFTGGSATTASGWDNSWANAGPLNLGISVDYAGNPAWWWTPGAQPDITIGLSLSGDTTILDRLTLTYAQDGAAGATGTRGTRQILVTTATGAWADQTAWDGIVSQTGTNPVPSDLVTIAKSDGTVANSKFYVSGSSPGVWQTPTAYINGSLLVTGTVGANQIAANSITADRIDSRGLSIKDAAGNIILQAGTPLNTSYIGNALTNLSPSLRRWTYNGGLFLFAPQQAAADATAIYIPANDTNQATSPLIALDAGFTYTVSISAVYYGGSGVRTVSMGIYTSGGSLVPGTSFTFNITGANARYSNSFTVSSSANYTLRFAASNNSHIVQIWDVKLERNAVATPWSPHQPDYTSINNPVTSSNVTTFIASAAINNAQIGTLSADKINTGTLNASVVAVTNLNATNITGGTLSVDRISANSITGGKISTTNGANLTTNNINLNAVTNSYPGVVGLQFTNTTSGTYTWTQAVNANSGTGRRFWIMVAVRFYSASGTTYTMTWDIIKSGVVQKSGNATSISGASLDVRTLSLMHVDTSPSDSGFNYDLRMTWSASNTSACYYQFDYVILELKR